MPVSIMGFDIETHRLSHLVNFGFDFLENMDVTSINQLLD